MQASIRGGASRAGALLSHPPAWLRALSDPPGFPYVPRDVLDISVTTMRGPAVLHDPVCNKGTSFPLAERERLGLRGLLPPRVFTMEQQMSRMLERYRRGDDFISAAEVEAGGVTHEMTRRWLVLQELQDRNETLFYRMLTENFAEMAPIIYTPTVGWACLNWGRLFRRPRGMYFSAQDRGEMAGMVYNWPADQVDAIVVTDGSRILGLGDLGANGLPIPIGKLDLYVAAGGFNPRRVLPCVIDVGTDNPKLLEDDLYMGLRQPRITGEEYYEIVDEFVRAVTARWPGAVLQFEDFSMQHAKELLERYRYCHTVWNDDIQGTACTALAGLYGAMRVLGRPLSALADQRFVVVGAGSAGIGVTCTIAQALVKHGLSPEQSAARFHVLDHRGLLTAARPGVTGEPALFARRDAESREGEGLVDVIRRVKPNVLIGLAGAGRLFTQEALRLMGEFNERPIIFPMSNPTSQMECTHAEAQAACGGRAIFASGSPQPDVTIEGRTLRPSQANNMFAFPGISLGTWLSRGGQVTDGMLQRAAEALPALITDEGLARGECYPELSRAREISIHVALETMKAAAEEGHLSNVNAMKALARSDEDLRHYIRTHLFTPEYTSLVLRQHK